jgi:nitric oxide reductase NorD protein
MTTSQTRKLFADELAEALDRILFASPSHRTRTRVADGLQSLNAARQQLVLHWTAVVAELDAELAWSVARQAPDALRRLNDSEFARWVGTALVEFDRAGRDAAKASLSDLDGFAARCAQGPPEQLDAVRRRLQLFLSGLGGFPVSVQPALTSSAANARGWSDGDTLFLPSTLPAMGDDAAAFRGLALLLWAQGRYGGLPDDLAYRLDRMPDSQLAERWFLSLEGVRLRACLLREFPGLHSQLPEPREFDSVQRRRLESDVASVEDSWDLLLDLFDAVPPASTLGQGGRLDREALSKRRTAGGKPGDGMANPASQRRLPSNLFGDVRRQPPANPSPRNAGMSLDLTVSDDMGSVVPSTGATSPDQQDATTVAPVALNSPDGPGVMRPAGHGQLEQPEATALITDSAAASDGIPDAVYDEWDWRRQAYRESWCKVFASDATAADPVWVSGVRRRRAPLLRQIRRRFEHLRGEDRWFHRQCDGEELDMDAVIAARVGQRSGADDTAAIFSRRVRSERSVAVMFMIDMSGSTKGWVNDAEREALVMLSEALDTLGDRYAIYGFSGLTHQRCDIYRIKAFDERGGSLVDARISGIDAREYTRMGVAVRHLSAMLLREPARHRLLVTLSDGRPDDYGDAYRGRYGIEDTRRALHEARQQGIRSYCVTIDRHAADYLPELYGPAHFSVLANVGELPQRIAEVFRRWLGNAG